MGIILSAASKLYESLQTSQRSQPRSGSFRINIVVENAATLDDIVRIGEIFEDQAVELFNHLTFEVHKYLIRSTPLNTGRLRAGWTAFLEENQQDYSAAMGDTSLVPERGATSDTINASKIALGRSESSYDAPNPFSITLINAVPYAFYVEEGTSKMAPRRFVANTRYKAESYMIGRFEEWLRRIAETGQVPELGDIVQEIGP